MADLDLGKLQDPSVQGEWRLRELLGGPFRRYSAPFTVCHAQWNPCIDLLVLASEKGEINTRRRSWKRGWKTALGNVKPLLHDKTAADEYSKVRAVCWSPGGMILAVGFCNGFVHLLDREAGHVLYSITIGCAVRNMRWGRLSEDVKLHNDDRFAGLISEVQMPSQPKNEKSTNSDGLELLKTFCDDFVKSEILGAVLFVIDDENCVHVLISGLLPVVVVKPPIEYFGKCDPYSISVGDVILQGSHLFIAYSSIGESSKPRSENVLAFGYNTQIIKFDIDSAGWFKNGSLWKITYRWLRLFYSICCISEAYSKVTVDWEEQAIHYQKAFDEGILRDVDGNRLTTSETLVGQILNGNNEIELKRYFRELSDADWKKMRTWVGKGFSKLIEALKNEMWSSVELYQHHLKTLMHEFEHSIEHIEKVDILPKRIFNVDVYPYGGHDEEQVESVLNEGLKKALAYSDDLAFKVSELIAVAVRNRKEMNNFTRWLSHISAFQSKGPPVGPNTSTKYDIQAVIEFIVEVFISSKKIKDVLGLSKQTSEQVEKLLTDSSYRKSGTREIKERKSGQDSGGEGQAETGFKIFKGFEKVAAYFNPSERLEAVLDLRRTNFSSPDSPVAARERATSTLAQCVKNSIESLNLIRVQILKIYSPMVKPISNVVLEEAHSEGFNVFNFFSFKVSDSINISEKVKNGMKKKFGCKTVPALSCIGSDGHRHIVYTASGELITNTAFDDQHLEKAQTARMSDTHDDAGTEGRSGSTTPVAVEHPISVDTSITSISSKSGLRGILSSISNCRLVQFDSLDEGSYFGLIRAKRCDDELTYLFRSYFGDKALYVHEDQSGSESFEKIAVSGRRKIGIAMLEPQYTLNGTSLRWFDVDDSNKAGILGTKRTILGEVERKQSIRRVSRSSISLVDEFDAANDFESTEPTSTYRLKESARKKKISHEQ